MNTNQDHSHLQSCYMQMLVASNDSLLKAKRHNDLMYGNSSDRTHYQSYIISVLSMSINFLESYINHQFEVALFGQKISMPDEIGQILFNDMLNKYTLVLKFETFYHLNGLPFNPETKEDIRFLIEFKNLLLNEIPRFKSQMTGEYRKKILFDLELKAKKRFKFTSNMIEDSFPNKALNLNFASYIYSKTLDIAFDLASHFDSGELSRLRSFELSFN